MYIVQGYTDITDITAVNWCVYTFLMRTVKYKRIYVYTV